jgi:hypothetical protein
MLLARYAASNYPRGNQTTFGITVADANGIAEGCRRIPPLGGIAWRRLASRVVECRVDPARQCARAVVVNGAFTHAVHHLRHRQPLRHAIRWPRSGRTSAFAVRRSFHRSAAAIPCRRPCHAEPRAAF